MTDVSMGPSPSLPPPNILQAMEAVEKYVGEYGGVSMIEVTRLVRSFIPVDGEMIWHLSKACNAILWAGMTDDFIDFMAALIARKNVCVVVCAPLVYLIDGGGMLLPVARQAPRKSVPNGYAKPKWLPICLCKPSTGKKIKKKIVW